jgi:hypothetical protein
MAKHYTVKKRSKGRGKRGRRKAKKGGSLFAASLKTLGSALVPLAFFQSARVYSRKMKKSSRKKTRKSHR